MPRQPRFRRELNLDHMFETRSEAWERVGLSVEVNRRELRRARQEAFISALLFVGLLVAYDHAPALLGRHGRHGHPATLGPAQTPVQIGIVIALLALGWAFARAIGKTAGPTFMRRIDPSTAGTVGFVIRLLAIVVVLLVALDTAGVHAQTLAVGSAFTAVIFGLAAQQTLGNAIAGMVLLSARPFRVGERVRLQAGALGGPTEGIVSAQGLLYTTLTRGADRIMIPNNMVLAASVVPVREPDAVDVKVTLSSGVRPSQVQAILDEQISVPTRHRAAVLLEEIDGEDIVVRVRATPEVADDGARLADEIIASLAAVTGEHAVQQRG